MGTISTGIGLVSGLNIEELVGKLIELESGTSKRLQTQIENNEEVRTLLSTLSLRVVGFNLAASQLGKGQSFTERIASSSSPALEVSASRGATVGSFQFTPRRLVGTHQLLSSGFASRTASIAAADTTIAISQGGFVNESTKLANLNGGTGVRTGSIRITDASGASSTIDLTGSVTVQDVVGAINAAANVNVAASVRGDQIRLVDNSGGLGTLQVQEVSGGFTASDLGLTSLAQNGNEYLGVDIYSLGQTLSLEVFRDGNGVRSGAGDDFTITAGSVTFGVDISDAKSVADVLDTINNNSGNTSGKIQASIDGDRLILTDTLGTDNISVTAVGGSLAAADLGIESTGTGGTLLGIDVLGSLDTVRLATLRGGSSTITAVPGTIDINGLNIDLSQASTLQDVIDGINTSGAAGVTASVNSAGNGIVVRRTGGSLTISDVNGNLAEFVKIAGSAVGTNTSIDSGDLDRQYVNENTRLASYGSASGVPKGRFQITDGNGASAVVDLTQATDETIGQVIREINTRGLAVSARINDTGDGILIEKTGGSGAISVQEVGGGTTARALGLLRSPNIDGEIDGSQQVDITVEAGTSLDGLLTKIAASGAPIGANVLNDGSGLTPFRLSLTSARSGASGRLLIDPGQTSLQFQTVSNAQDAVLLLGSNEPGASPVSLVSGSNTFTDLVPGLQITVREASTAPVAVTVSENVTSVLDAARTVVERYNEIRDFLKENASYDAETDTRGKLFLDTTTRQIERQLSSFITSAFRETGSSIRTLGQVGTRLQSDGRLELDEEQFNALVQTNRKDVELFFSATGTGVVANLQSLTQSLTSVANGLVTGRVELLGRTIERQQQSLDQQEARLKAKEELLFRQFFAMETALSSFQAQQSTLTQLASLATSFANRR